MEIVESEGKKMIEHPNAPHILKQLFDILEWRAAMRERMIESAIRAEEDIKAGRVYTSEEVRGYFKKYLNSC
jgi:hypothetical protein